MIKLVCGKELTKLVHFWKVPETKTSYGHHAINSQSSYDHLTIIL
jgi:hypothetical protein